MAVRRRLLWCGAVVAGVGAALLCGAGVAAADPGAKTHSNNTASSSSAGPSAASSQGKSTSGGLDGSSVLPSAGLQSSSIPGSLTSGGRLPATLAPPRLVASPVAISVPPVKPHVGIDGRQSERSVQEAAGADGVQKAAGRDGVQEAAGTDERTPTVPGVTVLPTIAGPTTAVAPASPAAVPSAVPAASVSPNLATRVVQRVLSALGWSARPETAATLVTPAKPAVVTSAKPAAVSDALSLTHLASNTAASTKVATALADPAADTQVSSVVVGHSTLTIPSGKGVVVRADWYFPTGAQPPEGLIYLQNGWLANKGDYNLLAAALAEQTDSIVVVPTISSIPLPCGCWLGTEAMASGVAQLFVGNRAALTASASAAAGEPVTLPQDFVLAGHSAGGGLVVDAAGDMVENGAINDLDGVVLFDADPFNNMGPPLAELSGVNYRPVYQIASPPSFFNTYGNGTAQLLQARPGQFDGVMLVVPPVSSSVYW